MPIISPEKIEENVNPFDIGNGGPATPKPIYKPSPQVIDMPAKPLEKKNSWRIMKEKLFQKVPERKETMDKRRASFTKEG